MTSWSFMNELLKIPRWLADTMWLAPANELQTKLAFWVRHLNAEGRHSRDRFPGQWEVSEDEGTRHQVWQLGPNSVCLCIQVWALISHGGHLEVKWRLLGVISVLLYGPWGSNLSHQGSWQSHLSSEPSCYLQMLCFNSALFHSIQLLEYVWDISQAHLTSEYSNLKNYQWHT